MKTAKIIATLCLMSLATLAFADDAHHPDEKAQPAPSQPASMQMNMKRMHEQMAQIRAASDPKERARLVDEHMKVMQSMSAQCQMMEQAK